MEYKYTAFISYRHIEPDATIAQKIHTIIETFPIPKEFYVDGKKPVFRVFRDREELTTSSLSDSIDEALRSSKFLVVICSKRLPLSVWCNREVETFIQLHGIDRVIPVLIEGEPNESFPEALKAKEILAAELRTPTVLSPDFTSFEDLQKTNPDQVKTLANQAIELLNKTEKYRIMAAILGITYGDLVQRDKQRRQKLLTRIFVGATVLLSVFGLFMFNAYRNENIARVEAVQSNSKLLLDRAQSYLDNGDRVLSVLISDHALSALEPSMQQYNQLKSQHIGILNDAINIQQPSIMAVINNENKYAFSTISPDNTKILGGYGNGQIGVWDLQYGNLIKVIDAHLEQVKLLSFTPDGTRFVSGAFDDHFKVWDSTSYEQVADVNLGGFIMHVEYSHDGEYLYTISYQSPAYELRKFSTKDYKQVGDAITINNSITRLSLSTLEPLMIVRYDTYQNNESLVLYDLETMKEIRKIEDQSYPSDVEGEDPLVVPYTEVYFLMDSENIIATNVRGVYLIHSKSGQVLAKNEMRISNDSMIRQNKQTKDTYISTIGAILQMDSNTLENKREINFGGGTFSRFDVSVNNDIAVIYSDGQVGLAQDGVVTQRSFDYGNGLAEYVRFSKDGKYIVFDSLTNKQFKIAQMNVTEPAQEIPGSVQLVSDNSHYTLFSTDATSFLWDNQTQTRLKDITFKNRISSDARRNHLSNDGKHLVSFLTMVDISTNDVTRELSIIDTNTSEIIFSQDLVKAPSIVRFHPDASNPLVIVGYNDGNIEVIDYVKQTVVKKLEIVQGYIQNLGFSNDYSYIYFEYGDGATSIYDYQTNQHKTTLAGSLFFLDVKDNQLYGKGINNNRGFIYHEGQPITEIRLDDKRDYIAPNARLQDEDIQVNRYHREKDLLLTIVNYGDFKRGYLIDFSTGNLLKTYNISIRYRNALGYISPLGDKVILDQFLFNIVNPDYDYNDPNSNYYIESKQASFVHSIQDYETLLELSKPILEHRSFTELEKEQLGIQK